MLKEARRRDSQFSEMKEYEDILGEFFGQEGKNTLEF
jgi:hypothetical protein